MWWVFKTITNKTQPSSIWQVNTIATRTGHACVQHRCGEIYNKLDWGDRMMGYNEIQLAVLHRRPSTEKNLHYCSNQTIQILPCHLRGLSGAEISFFDNLIGRGGVGNKGEHSSIQLFVICLTDMAPCWGRAVLSSQLSSRFVTRGAHFFNQLRSRTHPCIQPEEKKIETFKVYCFCHIHY